MKVEYFRTKIGIFQREILSYLRTVSSQTEVDQHFHLLRDARKDFRVPL